MIAAVAGEVVAGKAAAARVLAISGEGLGVEVGACRLGIDQQGTVRLLVAAHLQQAVGPAGADLDPVQTVQPAAERWMLDQDPDLAVVAQARAASEAVADGDLDAEALAAVAAQVDRDGDGILGEDVFAGTHRRLDAAQVPPCVQGRDHGHAQDQGGDEPGGVALVIHRRQGQGRHGYAQAQEGPVDPRAQTGHGIRGSACRG